MNVQDDGFLDTCFELDLQNQCDSKSARFHINTSSACCDAVH